MITYYIGLTIGPIIEVLQRARKTRELWMGSYVFSFLMRTMIQKLHSQGYQFLSPFFNPESVPGPVGLFHDRFIAMSEKNPDSIEKELNAAIDVAIDTLTEIIIKTKSSKPEKTDSVRAYLKKYLQISYIITPLKKEDNIFIEINNFLDNAELQRTFICNPCAHSSHFEIFKTDEKRSYATDPLAFLQFYANQSSLRKNAFKQKRFLSMPEISGKEIKIKIDDEDDRGDPFPPKTELKYKYAALIQADGDNIGKLVKKTGTNPDDAKEFSKALFAFAAKVSELSEPFGAQVIYAGGDDVLAFAPIVYNKYTVFDYLDELNRHFKYELKRLDLEETRTVSLSFGVTAVYYKHPLYEALGKAQTNLFEEAKRFKHNGVEPKNAIAFELIKHSGQSMKNIFLQKDNDVYTAFKKLLNSELNEISAIPHNLHHNLMRSRRVITQLSRGSDFPQRLAALFENNFDESIHQEHKVKTGLGLTRELMVAYFRFYREESSHDTIFDEFFSALGIIKHLRGDR